MWTVPTDLSQHQTCRHDLFLLNDIVLLYIHASFAAAEDKPTLPQDAWLHPDGNGEKCGVHVHTHVWVCMLSTKSGVFVFALAEYMGMQCSNCVGCFTCVL